MIRVYTKIGSDISGHIGRFSDPAEAEARYLALVSMRTAGAGAVVLDPGRGRLVEEARYRTDREWTVGPREQVSERWRQMWAPADQWTGPTSSQLRALPIAAGVSGSEIARRIGVQSRQWRRWLADPDSGATRIPYAAWVAALRLTGLLPVDEHAGPKSTSTV